MPSALGAPIVFLTPIYAYLLTWMAAWIVHGLPRVAVAYWPLHLFCGGLRSMNLFCGRTPGNIDYFLLLFFLIGTVIGWEAMRNLAIDGYGPRRMEEDPGIVGRVSRVLAIVLLVLPLLVAGPHILLTTQILPGVFARHGWSTFVFLDFLQMWRGGLAFLLAYALLRRSAAGEW